MRVTLLGTGCPVVDASRYGPATLVQQGDIALLVDCGSGVTQRLLQAGCPGSEIDALLLSHLHSDHLMDLYQWIISSWHAGRQRPQRVFGPPGTRDHVHKLMALWRDEREARILHERRPSTLALELEVTELAGGERLSFGDLRVDVVRVDHRPLKHAFGFAFEAGGKRAVVSGDTTQCPDLTDAARNADLLVHEVFMHHELSEIPGVRTREGIENVARYHTLSSVVGKIAAEANVGCLMLTHFVPPKFNQAGLLAQVSVDYRGPLVLGEDLMSLNLTSNVLRSGDTWLSLGRPAGRSKRAPAN